MKSVQSGFTIIELISVIVILGVLAATALPRFANLGVEGRRASVSGISGGMRAAITIVKARWLTAASANRMFVDIGTNHISVVNANPNDPVYGNLYLAALGGNPIASGVGSAADAGLTAALESIAGYTVTNPTASRVNFMPVGAAASGGCSADYDDSTGLVTVSNTNC